MAASVMSLLLRWDAARIMEVTWHMKMVVLVIIRAHPAGMLSGIGHSDGDGRASALKHAAPDHRRLRGGQTFDLRRATIFALPNALPGIVEPAADLLLRLNRNKHSMRHGLVTHYLANI